MNMDKKEYQEMKFWKKNHIKKRHKKINKYRLQLSKDVRKNMKSDPNFIFFHETTVLDESVGVVCEDCYNKALRKSLGSRKLLDIHIAKLDAKFYM